MLVADVLLWPASRTSYTASLTVSRDHTGYPRLADSRPESYVLPAPGMSTNTTRCSNTAQVLPPGAGVGGVSAVREPEHGTRTFGRG
jgi:hypothetical protein